MSKPPNYSIHAWQGFDGLEDALWNCQCLFESAKLDPLCNSPDWLIAYARAFLRSDEVFGWTLLANGAPGALFPFRTEPQRGPLSLKRAMLLTDGTFDSDYLGLWIQPGIEEDAVEICLDLLTDCTHSEAVVLSGIPENSPILPALRRVLERRGLPRRERPAECLSAELPASFEDYLAGLKRRVRTKVRQALRVTKANGTEHANCDDPDLLDGRLSEMFELHEQRWLDAGQDGVFADLRRRKFYRQIATLALSRGTLRLSYLQFPGRRIAFQFGIVEGDRYYQMQEAYAPEFADMRVGVALRAMSIQSLIAEGVRHYDFMSGESQHKRNWGGKPRSCTTVGFALPSWRAKLAYGVRALLDRRTRDREKVCASA